MLKAGYTYCTRCGRVTTGAYYYSVDDNRWVRLKLGRRGKIDIELYDIEQKKDDDVNNEDGYYRGFGEYEDGQDQYEEPKEQRTYYSRNNSDENKIKDIRCITRLTRNHIPHSINVTCTFSSGEAQTSIYERRCPFCVNEYKDNNNDKNSVPLIAGLGDYPTYVIGVIGNTGVGKTCWISSVFSQSNLNAANCGRTNGSADTGYILSALGANGSQVHKPDKTELNALGETGIIQIVRLLGERRDATPEPVAQVLLVDFPGEYFETNDEFVKHAHHIICGSDGYSGVDAIVLMTDPFDRERIRNINNTQNNGNNGNRSEENNNANEGEQRVCDISTVYGILQENYKQRIGKYPPLAVVMNQIDNMIEFSDDSESKKNSKKKPPMQDFPGTESVPLFDEYTFPKNDGDMYRMEQLLPRIALETSLLRKIEDTMGAIDAWGRYAGFMIKACEVYTKKDKKTGKDVEWADFVRSINVMDPLLWILNELDIFPIEGVRPENYFK